MRSFTKIHAGKKDPLKSQARRVSMAAALKKHSAKPIPPMAKGGK